MTEPSSEPLRQKPFQYGLRSLFVITTILALSLGLCQSSPFPGRTLLTEAVLQERLQEVENRNAGLQTIASSAGDHGRNNLIAMRVGEQADAAVAEHGIDSTDVK